MIDSEDDSDLVKSVTSFTLDEITNSTLVLSLKFNDSSLISRNIKDPDQLEVKFLRPGLVTDANTGIGLLVQDSFYTLKLKP